MQTSILSYGLSNGLSDGLSDGLSNGLSNGLNGQIMGAIKRRYEPQGIKFHSEMNFPRMVDHIQDFSVGLIILSSQGKAIDDCLNIVQRIRSIPSSVPIILVTRHSSEARVIAALRAGVNDYLKTPLSIESMIKSVGRLLKPVGKEAPERGHRAISSANNMLSKMVGSCASMRSIKSYLAKVADTMTTVLITGETGTGKALAADFIHRHSQRAGQPMVTVNCAALPESLAESELFGYERGAFTGAMAKQPGKFAQADGGTIFLDEIGDMRPFIQAKILHAIEQKTVFPLGAAKALPINTRIIAASNQELEKLIVDGQFREDLYYRLNIARIALPPLRDRKEDIPDLIDHGIDRFNHTFHRNVKGMTPQAMGFLMDYDWPGNVRELMNLIEATFINLPRGKIDHADLPGHFKRRLQKGEGKSEGERRSIVDALMKTNWNKSHAAQKLNWSRMTLYRKMALHKIVPQRNPVPPELS